MSAWPWVLAIDDVVVLTIAVLFVILHQRIYTILAFILILLTFAINIITMIYQNIFILSLPLVLSVIFTFIARPFMKGVPTVSMRSSMVILIFSVIALASAGWLIWLLFVLPLHH